MRVAKLPLWEAVGWPLRTFLSPVKTGSQDRRDLRTPSSKLGATVLYDGYAAVRSGASRLGSGIGHGGRDARGPRGICAEEGSELDAEDHAARR